MSTTRVLDGTVVPQLDVGRLQIAVDDALGMRGVERIGKLTRDPQRLAERNGTLRETLSQCGTLNELECQCADPRPLFETIKCPRYSND